MNIKSIALLIVLVNAVTSVPKCLVKQGEAPSPGCATISEWKESLLCRIRGPADEAGQRSGGFMADVAEQPGDSAYTRNVKKWSRSVYSLIATILGSQWYFLNPMTGIKAMAYYEWATTRVGRTLYGVNWVTGPPRCGLNGLSYSSCGDKGAALTPVDC